MEVDAGFPPSFMISMAESCVLANYVKVLRQKKDQLKSKWDEFVAIVWETEGHVHRRLMDRRWSRGEPQGDKWISPSWNNNEHINLYNILNAGGRDSTAPTPEAYRQRICELKVRIHQVEKEIRQARARNSRECRGLEVTFIARNKLYVECGKRSPHGMNSNAAGSVFLTVDEASMLRQLLKTEQSRLELESTRMWGLCRDWGASLQNHLRNALQPKHFQIGNKQFNKRVAGIVLQHTVNPISDLEGNVCANSFTFIIDAWKNPTEFHELNSWQRKTGYQD